MIFAGFEEKTKAELPLFWLVFSEATEAIQVVSTAPDKRAKSSLTLSHMTLRFAGALGPANNKEIFVRHLLGDRHWIKKL